MEKLILESFKTKENLYLLNPYLEDMVKDRLLKEWKALGLEEHFFICSSGTSSGTKVKSYAISFDALFRNASAVNNFLNVSNTSKWLLSLPPYHIGGLSIIARCFLGGQAYVINKGKWEPHRFVSFIEEESINYLSLVPTQLYDICSQKLKCPKAVTGVFVGGDFLSETLARRAFELGWPIIKTFGMTEVCSQIASSFWRKELNGFMEVLPIHKFKFLSDNIASITSKALYTCEMILDGKNFSISKAPETLNLPDTLEYYAKNDKLFIKPLGRKGSEFKVKGRLYNFLNLKEKVDEVLIKNHCKNNIELILENDERDGKKLCLIIESVVKDSNRIFSEINQTLPKPLQLSSYRSVEKIPRTSIGKVKIL